MIELVQRSLFEIAEDIRTRLKRTAEDIIAIGNDLIEAKEQIQLGHFENWLRTEFDMSRRSAYRFMRVAERFQGTTCATLALTSTVLYELLDSDESIIQKVESGQIPASLPAIREAKKEMEATNLVSHPIETGYEFKPEVYTPPDATSESLHVPLGLTHEQRYVAEVDAANIDWLQPNDEHAIAKKRDAHVMQVMGSSESPEWYTPQEIVRLTIELLGTIDLDPCSNSHETPNVPASTVYTKEDNGLSQEWRDKVYLNPPYGSEIPQWVNKLISSYQVGLVTEAVALLPARIDTQWFQPFYEEQDCLMCHVRGRIQFENSPHHAPFPCVIVYLGKHADAFVRVFRHKGPIMRRIG